MQELQQTQILFLGQEDPLEEEMATHSSIIARKICPWGEHPIGAWQATVHGVSESRTRLSMQCMLEILKQLLPPFYR